MQAQELYMPYYTKSASLVNYMVHMLSLEAGAYVFEPCAGDGVFIDALIKAVSNIQIDAYELNPAAFLLLKEKYKTSKNIHLTHADTLLDEQLMLLAHSGGAYDRIIANPPYGAWQNYEKRKDLKKLYPNFYIKETYALFLFRCIQLLKEGGKLVFIIPDTFLNLHMHTSLRSQILTTTRIVEIVVIPSAFFPNVNFGYSKLSIITLEKSFDQKSCLNNQFKILTDLSKVKDLESTVNHKKYYTFSQLEVYNHPDHAVFVADNPINFILTSSKERIGDVAECVTGLYSGNDKQFLRPVSPTLRNSKNYRTLDGNLICPDYLTIPDLLYGIDNPGCFIPIVKGGAVKYLKPDNWYIEWSKEAVHSYKTCKKARFQNSDYYFKYGIGIPMVSSSQITAALIEQKVFDQSIVGVFPKNPEWLYYLLAFFNSPTCNKLIRTINPSANNSANYIKKIPFITPSSENLKRINLLMEEILSSLRAGRTFPRQCEEDMHKVICEIYGL